MIEYYIKEIKGEFIVKEKNNNRTHNKFSSKKQAEDKIKRLRYKDKSISKSKKEEDKYIPKDISNPLPDTYEVNSIMKEGLKDDNRVKKLKLKKKLNDLNSI